MEYDKRCHFFAPLALPFRVKLTFLHPSLPSGVVCVCSSLSNDDSRIETFFFSKIRPFVSFVSNVFGCFWRLTTSQNATHKHVHGKPNIYILIASDVPQNGRQNCTFKIPTESLRFFISLALSLSLPPLANSLNRKKRKQKLLKEANDPSRMLSLTRHYGFLHRPSIDINW